MKSSDGFLEIYDGMCMLGKELGKEKAPVAYFDWTSNHT